MKIQFRHLLIANYIDSGMIDLELLRGVLHEKK